MEPNPQSSSQKTQKVSTHKEEPEVDVLEEALAI